MTLCGKISLHRPRRICPSKQKGDCNQPWQVEFLSFRIFSCIYYEIRGKPFLRLNKICLSQASVCISRLSLFRLPTPLSQASLCLIPCPSSAYERASVHLLWVRGRFPSGIHSFTLNSPAVHFQPLQFPHLIPFFPGHLNIKIADSKYQHQLEHNDRQFLANTFPRPKLKPTPCSSPDVTCRLLGRKSAPG